MSLASKFKPVEEIKLDYPAGYYVNIETWENDADDYSTQTTVVKKIEDADFLIALAKLFTSRNERSNPGMGNEEHGFGTLTLTVKQVLNAHPDISEDLRQEWQGAIDDDMSAYSEELEGVTDEDEMMDLIGDLNNADAVYQKLCDDILGHPVQYEYGFCRVYDNHLITLQEEPVSVQLVRRQMIIEDGNRYDAD